MTRCGLRLAGPVQEAAFCAEVAQSPGAEETTTVHPPAGDTVWPPEAAETAVPDRHPRDHHHGSELMTEACTVHALHAETPEPPSLRHLRAETELLSRELGAALRACDAERDVRIVAAAPPEPACDGTHWTIARHDARRRGARCAFGKRGD